MDTLLKNFIFNIGGEICVRLAEELEALNGEITDQELADRLGEDQNITRKNLYKLLDYNLVKYRRMREKKNQWIIFLFEASFDGYHSIILERNEQMIEVLKKRLEYEEENMFYACDAGCTRLTFDDATDIDFRCPSCDEILNFRENDNKIDEIKKKIDTLEKENKKIAKST